MHLDLVILPFDVVIFLVHVFVEGVWSFVGQGYGWRSHVKWSQVLNLLGLNPVALFYSELYVTIMLQWGQAWVFLELSFHTLLDFNLILRLNNVLLVLQKLWLINYIFLVLGCYDSRLLDVIGDTANTIGLLIVLERNSSMHVNTLYYFVISELPLESWLAFVIRPSHSFWSLFWKGNFTWSRLCNCASCNKRISARALRDRLRQWALPWHNHVSEILHRDGYIAILNNLHQGRCGYSFVFISLLLFVTLVVLLGGGGGSPGVSSRCFLPDSLDWFAIAWRQQGFVWFYGSLHVKSLLAEQIFQAILISHRTVNSCLVLLLKHRHVLFLLEQLGLLPTHFD